MKNISRRVFIKGMAVAAVATAASTVLTGCKLPGNVQDEVENNTPTSNVLTADKVGTLTVSSLQFQRGNELVEPKKGIAQFKFVPDIETGKEIGYYTSVADAENGIKGKTAGTYYAVVPTAYYDGNVDAGVGSSDWTAPSNTAKKFTGKDVEVQTATFTALDSKKNSTVTVKFTLYKIVVTTTDTAYGTEAVQNVTFTYNI